MNRVWMLLVCTIVILGVLYWFFGRDINPTGSNNVYSSDKSLLVEPAKTDSTSAPTAVDSVAGQNAVVQNQPTQNQNPKVTSGPVQTNNQSTNNTRTIMDATFHTNKGDITIIFNPTTPKTVENFLKLADSGFYNGTKFHRVIKGFMNQGGDPLSKDNSMMDRWGTGGPGYQFADEITKDNKNDLGTIAMANAGPNTNGSQFFFNAANNNFLDDKHTVFGKVTAGMDVVMAINEVQTGSNDRPVEPIIINSITLK